MEEFRTRVRTVIVDDEPLARTNLKILLGRYPEAEIIAECGSGLEAVEEIRKTRPDLVFLDVQMPECDGFDVLEMLGPNVPPALIFVTAFDQYALKAFEAGALDYLLKPFGDDRFERALSRAKQKIESDKIVRDRPALRAIRLTIKSAGEILFVPIVEIDWIEAADYYACLHVGAKTHLLRRSLSELEQELDPNLFRRIHRSAIVNLARVSALHSNRNGEYEVLLNNGSSLAISRRYWRLLQSSAAGGPFSAKFGRSAGNE